MIKTVFHLIHEYLKFNNQQKSSQRKNTVMKWKEFIELQANLDPDEEIAAIIWTRRDVFEKSSEDYPDVVMTNEIADEVLRLMDNNADCQFGMTWDTLEDQLKEVLQERKLI